MGSWQQERRADKAAQAEQRRADGVAAAQQQRENAMVAAQIRRDNDTARLRQQREDAQRRRAERAARRAALAAWLRANTLDLMFVPVIVIPAVLAWPAMAAYGTDVFGGWGVLLPGFTEGCMWVFAFAVALAARAERPTVWLQVGVWVSAAMAAAMNYAHGAEKSVAYGLVMALVSVGGVVVHQLVAARPPRPRRTRAERDAAKVADLARRRLLAVRLAAVADAAAQLDHEGTATLVHRPRTVALSRRPWRGPRLVDTTVPGLPVTALPELSDAGAGLAEEIGEYLATLPSGAAPARAAGEGGDTPGNAETPSGDPLAGLPAETAVKVRGMAERVRAAMATGRLDPAPSQNAVRKFLRCRAEIARHVHRAITHGPDDTGTEVPA
jgi:hypothetical protein